MQRFRKILVGVDLSHADRLAADALNASTRTAIDEAIRLAAQNEAEITFFSALDFSTHVLHLMDHAEDATAMVEQSAQKVLSELIEKAGQHRVVAQGRFLFGKPWVEIIREVLKNQHDLVVVGTRDLSRSQRLIFGSTAMKLLRNCPCPVWVTKPGPHPEDDGLKILVATDLNEVSQRAMQIAIEGGPLWEPKIRLLHVVEDPYMGSMHLTGLSESELEGYRQRMHEEAEQTLHQQLSMTDYRTLTYGVQVHVVDGEPHEAILQAIDEYDIDLLVMGTIGRSGIPGVFVGNTAERLLPQIPCSLLAVKPSDFRSAVTVD